MQRHRSKNRALATADGTIAAPRIDDPVREVKLQLHRAAMTRGPVRGLYGDSTNFLEHVRRSPISCASRVQRDDRSEEHTSELQSLMRISYAVFCLKKKNTKYDTIR